jgi:hypothetical protein
MIVCCALLHTAQLSVQMLALWYVAVLRGGEVLSAAAVSAC